MNLQAIGTRKLLGKFLLVQMPVFAFVSVLGIALLSNLFFREESNLLNARVGNATARVTSLLSRIPKETAQAQIEDYLGLLLADPAVMCAELLDQAHPVASAPHKIGCLGQEGFHALTVPVRGKNGQRLHVKFSDAELVAVKNNKRQFNQLVLVIGLLTATIASWFAFGIFVGRPVRNLLAAIRRSAETGATETVADVPADELGTVIEAFNAMQNRLAEEARNLKQQAVTDSLTGLPNRQGLSNYFESLRAENGNSEFAVLFVDLDNFKWINDTHGHEAGDTVLRDAAGRLRQNIATGDFLARLGGDEFAVILADSESLTDVRAVTDRILAAVTRPFHIWQNTAYVGCSIGVAGPSNSGQSVEELLRLADLAMYKSKQDGRNRVTIYSAEIGSSADGRDSTLANVLVALEQKQLRLFFQPIVDLVGLRPHGAEALLRIDAKDSRVSPAEFIQVAEQTGLIAQVGDFVLEHGLATGQRLTGLAAGGLNYVSINLSPKQLDPLFIAGLLKRLRANPALARRIIFEITETALLAQEERITAFFAEARAEGARIALDDFGTGYSSLSHVVRYPVDFIKLDRSFIRNIESTELASSRRNQALVRAAATLCQDLNIQVVAEGIETVAELAALQSFGIPFGQGYLFSRALPEGALADWVSAFSRSREQPRSDTKVG